MSKDLLNQAELTEFGEKSYQIFGTKDAKSIEALQYLGIEIIAVNHFDEHYKMIRHDNEERHFNVVFVIEGTVEVEFEDEVFIMKEGGCIFVPSWISRRIELVSGPAYKEIYIRLNMAQSDQLKRLEGACFQGEYGHKIMDLIQTIQTEEKTDLPFQSKIVQSAYQMIASYFYRECCRVDNVFIEETVAKLKHFWLELESCLPQAWTLDKLAADYGASRATFVRLNRKIYQSSPLEYLRALRIKKAQELLRTSSTSLDDIAELVGYSSVSSFSQAFFRETGERPGYYRKKG